LIACWDKMYAGEQRAEENGKCEWATGEADGDGGGFRAFLLCFGPIESSQPSQIELGQRGEKRRDPLFNQNAFIPRSRQRFLEK
jgi:hypothetical protein